MPDDSSSDQASVSDAYQNDPYRNRRIQADQNSITWQCPSTRSTQSYLPYSKGTTQQKQRIILPTVSSNTTRTNSLEDNGFHNLQDQRVRASRDFRQDSLLTTITTAARVSSSLSPNRPFLHSTMTSLSLSEEIRKQKYQHEANGWRRHPPLSLCGCCFGWNRKRRPSWKWIFFVAVCFLLVIGGILLFFCLPRLPEVTMAPMADTYGQDLADYWGPPQHPFYRTSWQLNLTMDNHPNFIPLHLIRMDLVLYIHPSSWNTSSSYPTSSLDTTTSTTNTTNTTNTNTSLIGNSSITSDALASHSTKITNASLSSPYLNNDNSNSSNTDQIDTAIPFAWSTIPAMTLTTDGQRQQVVNAIFHIDYVASSSNLTDPTFAQFYNACGPRGPFILNPPTLNVSLHITFYLLHYIWLPTMTVYPSEGNGLLCPVN
ncbi:hypothetical protein BCR42DRAFT_403201 [Absidia repens]|uniref:Uncharacterized protein n=1 Tax=Absidia repens TaxID=90262 RepID=A0A1X2IZ47_9FUNG|nr:hypothetical protein BCR42DRAFT_403201 [Absidia repens]